MKTRTSEIKDLLTQNDLAPDTASSNGSLVVVTFRDPEVLKQAACLLRLYGYGIANNTNTLMVGHQVKGNPFVDQRVFQHIFQKHLCLDHAANYALYRKLITEELKELDDAVTADEHLDALIDLIYVTIGAGIALGHDMQGAWDEVHKTNMAKLGPDGKPIIREDGKVIKPEGWKGPELKQFVGHVLEEFRETEVAR